MRRYVIGLLILTTILSIAQVSALDLDLHGARFAYDTPIVVTPCSDSSIGCSRIVSDPIHRAVSISTEPINKTAELWTAQITLSSNFSGTYRNVPLAIEVPRTAELHAGGNTPYVIANRNGHRYILMSVPELEGSKTVRIRVVKSREVSFLSKLSELLASF